MFKTINITTLIGVTFSIKEKMVKNKISTRSNVLNKNILDIFKLNAQVFQGIKEKSTMSLMIRKVNLIKKMIL